MEGAIRSPQPFRRNFLPSPSAESIYRRITRPHSRAHNTESATRQFPHSANAPNVIQSLSHVPKTRSVHDKINSLIKRILYSLRFGTFRKIGPFDLDSQEQGGVDTQYPSPLQLQYLRSKTHGFTKFSMSHLEYRKRSLRTSLHCVRPTSTKHSPFPCREFCAMLD